MLNGIIRRFEVNKLFNLYDYKFDLGKDKLGNDAHETLLYGDNGTGKTTLLRLMYHTLSKKRNDGSRSYIARVPFKSMAVSLSTGHRIEVQKEQLQGKHTFEVTYGTTSTTIQVNPDERFLVNLENSPDVPRLVEILGDLKIEELYLSDDRTIITTYDTFSAEEQELRRRRMEEERIGRRAGDSRDLPESLSRVDLGRLADRVSRIIRDKLLARSSLWQHNINNIYLNLAKRLAIHADQAIGQNTQFQDFAARVLALSTEYSKVELLQIFPGVTFDAFIQIVSEAKAAQQPNIIAVLGTYLDTIEAQINSVKDLAQLLNSLIGEINSYLVNKALTFSIHQGFRIVGSIGNSLSFYDLSSGERQLLFLMFISFITRDDKSIVYIDEPELSLNIKWQRQLISSLLKMISDTETQFIIATHSFEMLTMHQDNVINLNQQFAHGS